MNSSTQAYLSALVTHLVWVTTSVLISLRCFGGAPLQDQALATLRGQISEIISGIVFVFLGLAACGIAVRDVRSHPPD